MEIKDLLEVMNYNAYLQVNFKGISKKIGGSPAFISYIMEKQKIRPHFVECIDSNDDGIILVDCVLK